MKNKIISKLGILLSLTLFSGLALSASAEGISGVLINRVEHTDLNFEEMNYERMDEAEFDAIIVGLEDLAAEEANADAVLEVIGSMEDYYRELAGYSAIAHIYTTLEADNEEYNAELQYCDDLEVSVADKMMIAYQQVALSPCTEALEAYIDDEDFWEDILEYVPMTQEQKDLSSLETELSLKYDTLYNQEYTTTIRGVEYTMDSLDAASDEGTVSVQEFMEGYGDILTQRNQALGELYLELVEVRVQIAASYGYDNYAVYAYEEIYERDYSPEDLELYRDQVKTYVVPLMDELYDMLFEDYYDSYEAMFDQEITEDVCLETLAGYLPEISEDMLASYEYMLDHNLYNIGVDSAKAPGAYTISIFNYNAPYMFNCASGDFSDIQTLIHEFGHYNQMYYASEDMWYDYKSDLDLAEIHSQGLELLFTEYGDEIYGEYAEAMDIYSAFNQVYATVEGCKEDAFQFAVYENPEDLTVEKLNRLYCEACLEYGDYDLYNSYYLGLYGITPVNHISEWVEVPHTFQSPLYYVSYSISMAAVEELRDILMTDRQAGIAMYLDLVNAGYADGYQDTLEAMGMNNPITNPRFDVYTENIKVSLGMIPSSSQSVDVDDADEVDEIEEVEEVEEPIEIEVPDFKLRTVKETKPAVWMLFAAGGSGVLGLVLMIISCVLLGKKNGQKTAAKKNK